MTEKPRRLGRPPVRDIRQWITEKGFALEFHTASLLRRAGFRPTPGYFVSTDEDAPPRELDVHARWPKETAAGSVTLDLYVDCKYTKHAPWIILCSAGAGRAPGSAIASMKANPGGQALLWLLQDEQSLYSTHLFGVSDVPGYRGIEYKRDKDVRQQQNDGVYAALQAIASITAADLGSRAPAHDHHAHIRHARIAQPVLVVDGPLFRAFLNDASGVLNVKSVPWTRVNWTGSRDAGWIPIDVVRFPHLSSYLKRIAYDFDRARHLIADAQTRTLDALTSKSQDPIERYTLGKEISPLIRVPWVLHPIFAS